VTYNAFIILSHLINIIQIKDYNSNLKKETIVKGVIYDIIEASTKYIK